MIRTLRYSFILCVMAVLCSCKKNDYDLVDNPKDPDTTKTPISSPPIVITPTVPDNTPDINKEFIPDTRAITSGSLIYSNGYVDQPYVAQLPDSSWVCFFTTAKLNEGDNDQHIMITRSSDMGKTWSKPTDVEPTTGPISSWTLPYVTDYGRMYVFYTFNGDNITTLNGAAIRHDMLGWFCYKYSDDGGVTWSARRRIPIKNSSLDNNNDFKGTVQMFWGICKPIHTNKGMLLSYTKIGQFLIYKNEGWLLNCSNIETEKDPDNLQWDQLNGNSDVGIKNPNWSVQQEHNLVQLKNGTLYCVCRTDQGFPAFATSTNFGQTWTIPTAMRYGSGTTNDRIIKNPVACPRIFKCKNGNYILWYDNNGTTAYDNRNPAWVSGGIEMNGTIWWSEPEMLLYSSTVLDRMSYPDLIEQQGRYFITETQKSIARLHEISSLLLNDLWYQAKRKTKVTNSLVSEYNTVATNANIVSDSLSLAFNTASGFTVDFMVKLNSLGQTGIIFSNIDNQGNGVKIYTTTNSTIAISLTKGQNSVTWETDKGSIAVNTLHHIAFVADKPIGIITVMVDGKLCDGGTKAQFGWTRFSSMTTLSTSNQVIFASGLTGQLTNIKFYKRALRTSELVSNYWASK